MTERFAKVNEQEMRELFDNTTPKLPHQYQLNTACTNKTNKNMGKKNVYCSF